MADADTAAKRLSALDWCSFPYGVSLPLPDGTLSAGDMAQILGLYSGIAEQVPGGGDDTLYVRHYRRRLLR